MRQNYTCASCGEKFKTRENWPIYRAAGNAKEPWCPACMNKDEQVVEEIKKDIKVSAKAVIRDIVLGI